MKIFKNRNDVQSFISNDEGLTNLVEYVKRTQDHDDVAHDVAHFERVAIWTSKLLVSDINLRLVIAAAYLHDFINIPKNSPERNKASLYSANHAREILPQYGFDESEINTICDAILNHSFSRGVKPETELGKALQDADRLESLGVLGIMRTISTGARMGAQYFHATDPWAEKRELDDMKYSVDHFANKLFKLPDLMNTSAGREEGLRRTKIMKDFLNSLATELS